MDLMQMLMEDDTSPAPPQFVQNLMTNPQAPITPPIQPQTMQPQTMPPQAMQTMQPTSQPMQTQPRPHTQLQPQQLMSQPRPGVPQQRPGVPQQRPAAPTQKQIPMGVQGARLPGVTGAKVPTLTPEQQLAMQKMRQGVGVRSPYPAVPQQRPVQPQGQTQPQPQPQPGQPRPLTPGQLLPGVRTPNVNMTVRTTQAPAGVAGQPVPVQPGQPVQGVAYYQGRPPTPGIRPGSKVAPPTTIPGKTQPGQIGLQSIAQMPPGAAPSKMLAKQPAKMAPQPPLPNAQLAKRPKLASLPNQTAQPQITSQQVATQNLQNKFGPSSAPISPVPTPKKEEDEDGEGQDIDTLTDVTKLAGVDLDLEDTLHIKGQDEAEIAKYAAEEEIDFVDKRAMFTKLNAAIEKQSIVKELSPEAAEFLCLVTQEWLRDTLEQLVRVSKYSRGENLSRLQLPTTITSDVGKEIRLELEKERKEREERDRQAENKMKTALDKEKLTKQKLEEEERQRTTAANTAALNAIGDVRRKPVAVPSTTTSNAPRPPAPTTTPQQAPITSVPSKAPVKTVANGPSAALAIKKQITKRRINTRDLMAMLSADPQGQMKQFSQTIYL